MTTSAQLRDIAVTALNGVTDAGANVFSPIDTPTWTGEYPLLILTTDDEDGESSGRHGAPLFTVTTTLRVLARVEQLASENDAGAMAAYVALERLREQIKSAVINYTPLMQLLQQFPFFRTRIQVGNGEDSEKHLGQLVVDIGLEFIQTPDDFYQPATTPLDGVDLVIPMPSGTDEPGLTIDLNP